MGGVGLTSEVGQKAKSRRITIALQAVGLAVLSLGAGILVAWLGFVVLGAGILAMGIAQELS